ncbi:MAG: NUDIX domain-containing protein [Gammaproteobacteria bacterium]
MAEPREIHVVAGALRDAEGRILIAQRPRGRHMAGRWEFPGGKLDPGEDPLAGLKRELGEELGVTVRDARQLIRLRHEYPDRRVLLDVWEIGAFEGVPQPLDRQGLAWARPDELPRHDLLEADRAIVTALRLPRIARVVGDAAGLAALAGAVPQAILWPLSAAAEGGPDRERVQAARAAGHRVFVMGEDVEAVRAAAQAGCDGAVLHWHGQQLMVDRGGEFLIGARCDDAGGMMESVAEGAHFVLIAPPDGPVQERYLAPLCDRAGVPVIAGWYPDARRLEGLLRAGAHGCAIRRQLVPGR